MSKVVKCDFCKKILKSTTPYYTFVQTYTDPKYIDVCKSCYKKFIKSVRKAEELEEDALC